MDRTKVEKLVLCLYFLRNLNGNCFYCRCMDCGNSYHEKCSDSVPKNCTKYKAVEGVSQTLTRSQGDNGSITSSANTGQTSSQHFYEQFSSNVAENRTHEG